MTNSKQVVERDSAVLVGCHGVQLDSDHFKLNKFRDGTDSNYRTVTNNIKRIAAKGKDLLEKRNKGNSTHSVYAFVLSWTHAYHMPSDSRTTVLQHYSVSRKRVKDFIGREEQLESITTRFAAPRLHGPYVLIVHALGGQGKSQLALEYYRRSRARNIYRGVFWVQAANRRLAIDTFSKLAGELGVVVFNPQTKRNQKRLTSMAHSETPDQQDPIAVNGPNAMVQLVKKELEHWKERWLLIFDNYDHPSEFDDIQTLFPDGKKFCGE